MPSGNEVNITFGALRERVFDARVDMASDISKARVANVEMQFAQTISLIQIAQELNEIKHALNRMSPPLEELT